MATSDANEWKEIRTDGNNVSYFNKVVSSNP